MVLSYTCFCLCSPLELRGEGVVVYFMQVLPLEIIVRRSVYTLSAMFFALGRVIK